MQFTSRKMRLMCEKLSIRQVFSSVEHHQSNEQAEAANNVIMQGLKKKLGATKARWVEMLPGVIWSYYTTVQSTTKEMPFGLVYGGDIVLPIEIEMISKRVEDFSKEQLEERRLLQLDTINELRDKVRIREVAQK